MTPDEVRSRYLEFFKTQNHAIIPSASLVPENDPTTLFTGSGMQPMVPYLLGQTHPLGTRIADSQKCFRSQDIEEVGDNRHTTFFEMLGNWSLGDYFKAEQLAWVFTFLTDKSKGLNLDPHRLFVTVFSGSQDFSIDPDQDSIAIWTKLFATKGIKAKTITLIDEANASRQGMQGGRIFAYDANKNWWSRAGAPAKMPSGEPGGPDSEIFYDFQTEHSPQFGAHCHPNCDCGRFMEIGNSVFMQFQKQADGTLTELPQKNVDFGGGLERLVAATANNSDVFQTDNFRALITQLETISGLSYQDPQATASMRVIADHLKAATMLASDGVEPSNKDRGYFSRRLIRRAVRHGVKLGITTAFTAQLVPTIAAQYQHTYPNVSKSLEHISSLIDQEELKFRRTLSKGLKEFDKAPPVTTIQQASSSDIKIKNQTKLDPASPVLSPELAFRLYETYGFPLELTLEEAASRHIVIPDNLTELFTSHQQRHQDLSRTASAGKFKGGLADHSVTTTKLHTATHLLHKALRQVLGNHVRQEGSNITQERLRFDFTHPDKLTDDQLHQIETIINDSVTADYPVAQTFEPKDQAIASGAMAFFRETYPDTVSVYTIGDPQSPFSRELCGGPHVKSTGEIGTVTITKQESIGSGKRRLYATIS